ncbi:unnamed protein product [Pneumocystis jirovecii]|uniref:HTH La-type RNA-binding domain-containing protein n=2 Tax=Pneumocystis jirovecii TaxID=42068 RepID=L0PCT7_PNEJI|nr:uncharacterized protein T551_02789 [Pneumocystis jirovecii RU7]KTW27822.1 hypothetical protein T551_02789 [Pneumocystis jirovecii RU7]CCJ29430.1 unnamed protein product [Pneumocystis jirovecii]
MSIAVEEKTHFLNNERIISESSISCEKMQEKETQNEKIPAKNEEKVRKRNLLDLSDFPETDDPEAILQQVEFYFSDSNLPFDKFLWNTSQKNDGWVSIELISKFKRMRRFRPIEAIVKALRTSKDLLEISEDGEYVRRKTPLVKPGENEKTAYIRRSVYVKGFGEETKTSQIDIENFFKKYGKINVVRLRREDDGTFKGSAFCEFAELEFKENFLKIEPKPQYNGKDLLIMSKQEYIDMKSANSGDKSKKKKRFNAFKEMEFNNRLCGNENNKRKRDNSHTKSRNKKENKHCKLDNQENSLKENNEENIVLETQKLVES